MTRLRYWALPLLAGLAAGAVSTIGALTMVLIEPWLLIVLVGLYAGIRAGQFVRDRQFWIRHRGARPRGRPLLRVV